MNAVMIRKAARDMRWTVASYAVGLTFYALLVVLFFPSTGKLHTEVEKAIPEAMRAAFGLNDMGTLAGFVGGEFLNLIWPVIASVFLVMAGTGVVAQEVERGTIELWLSVPCSRARLLLSKLAVLLASIVLLAGVTLVGLWSGALLIGNSLSLNHLLLLGLVLIVFSVTIAAISSLLSTVFSSRGPAAGIVAGLIAASYLARIISSLSSGWAWLQYISLFTPFKAQDALAHGSLDLIGLSALVLVSTICVVTAVAAFNRRDTVA